MRIHLPEKKDHKIKFFGLIVGLAVFLIVSQLNVFSSLTHEARMTAAVGSLMAIWWATEAIPIPVTSLLPLVLLPLLGSFEVKPLASSYGHPLIFLFLGGFIIAIAMERWHLHKRIALNILGVFGTSSERIILGFMISSAAISMWVTNTATTMMMLPIALSIIEIYRPYFLKISPKYANNFSVSLLLGTAYAANIGGVATLVGTVPNALFAAFMESHYHYSISFLDWIKIGLPMALCLLPIAWFALTKVFFRFPNIAIDSADDFVNAQLLKLGPMTSQEKSISIVLGLTCSAWVFKSFIEESLFGGQKISDSTIALAGATLLFLIPSDLKSYQFLITWHDAKKLPWGLLLLFGGGLALATAISQSGLSVAIGDSLDSLDRPSVFTVMIVTSCLVIFLTELTSNIATTATFLPICASLIQQPSDAAMVLIPVTICASCAFMLPVATPPNAIVFGSGEIKIRDMIKVGFALNIMSLIVITALGYFWIPMIIEL